MTSYHEAMRRAMDVENRPGAECAHWLAVATELRQLFGDQIQARARVDFWSDRPAPEPLRDVTPPAWQWPQRTMMFGYDLTSEQPPTKQQADTARSWIDSMARSNAAYEVRAMEAAQELLRRWDESQAAAARAAFGEAVASGRGPILLTETLRDGDLRRTELGQLQEWNEDDRRWVDVDEPPAAPQAEADWWTREPLVDDAPVSPAHGEVHLSLGDRDPVNLGESTQVIRVPDMAAQMRVTDSATEITDRSAIRTCAWCTLSITYYVPASGGQAGWRHVRTGVAACADGVTLAWPGEPTPVE